MAHFGGVSQDATNAQKRARKILEASKIITEEIVFQAVLAYPILKLWASASCRSATVRCDW